MAPNDSDCVLISICRPECIPAMAFYKVPIVVGRLVSIFRFYAFYVEFMNSFGIDVSTDTNESSGTFEG